MPRLVYNFRGAGAGSVKSQIRDINTEAERAASSQEKRSKKLRRNRARNRLKRIREAKRAAQQEVRIAEKAAKDMARAMNKVGAMEQRARAKKLREQQRHLKQLERFAKREQAIQKRTAKRASGRNIARAAAFGSGALHLAGGAMAATAGVGIAAVRQQISLEDKARGLAIQGRGAGERGENPRDIVRKAQATAMKVGGVTAESVLDAMSTFVTRTGKFEVAEAMAETFATAARATGASSEDIAGAAADLFQKFDISGVEDMQEALAALTFQGKAGAFELADAAAQFPKLAAAAQRLGIGDGVESVRTLGGLAQLSRTSTGSAEEASTALENVFSALTTKQGAFKKHGVKVFEKDGSARDIQQLLVDVISKVGGKNVAKKKGDLAKLFGARGIRALSPLIDAYTESLKRGGDGASGVADALHEAIDAPGTWGDVVEDAATANESVMARLTTAWESIVAASGGELAPAIVDVAQLLTDALLNGGIDDIATAFNVAAEGIRTLGDMAELAADGLRAIGLIKDISPSKVIEREKKQQERLDGRIEAKAASKERFFRKARRGDEITTEDKAELKRIDTDIKKLLAERKVSEDMQAAAEVMRDGPLDRATTVKGAVTSERYFTEDQFKTAFVDAAGYKGTLLEASYAKSAENDSGRIIESIAAGRGNSIPTIGYSEAQQQLITELGAQFQALQSGIGLNQAPEDAFGLATAQHTAEHTAELQALGAAARSAAAELKSVKADQGGDIDG